MASNEINAESDQISQAISAPAADQLSTTIANHEILRTQLPLAANAINLESSYEPQTMQGAIPLIIADIVSNICMFIGILEYDHPVLAKAGMLCFLSKLALIKYSVNQYNDNVEAINNLQQQNKNYASEISTMQMQLAYLATTEAEKTDSTNQAQHTEELLPDTVSDPISQHCGGHGSLSDRIYDYQGKIDLPM